MLSLLTLGQIPQQNTDILNVIEKPAIVQPVEPSLEEKIATNYYKCNTDTQWIWAQDATCHDKQPTTNTKPATEPVRGSQGNTYEYGQCTWWVKEWKPSVGNWGNANEWAVNARADGWVVTSVPQIGAVAQTGAGRWGHVALVIGINGDSVIIKEGNYDFNGSVRTRSASISEFTYIY